MRDVFTFTIDPADAKDFDDAISFEVISDQTSAVSYQIGVHIADVSFYVKPGSKEDTDAYQRGTSVYLVDRVLPMLPERLCNNLCSLRPNEDKLCMSVVFLMDSQAKVLKYKICRTVIRSNARLDYDQAQEIIKPSAVSHQPSELTTALATLNGMAQKLRAERMAAGALDIEQEEMKFKLDKHGHPTEIYFEEPNEAHHLIEEFMLLTNRTVAAAVNKPFIYRVHDKPNKDKLEDLKQLTKRMGKNMLPQVMEMLTIRAQAKAVYSTDNIGHYGLAFTHYTHFTSPIRRYPDLMVHRLIDKYILTGKSASWSKEELEDIAKHCSECEQEAQQAERDSVKLFQTMWLSDHVGEILPGHISGVTEFGLFVQLDQSRCEGLVHISTIGADEKNPNVGDYFQYDEKNFRLIGFNSGKTYTLGDPVTVKVIRADINKAQIDFLLV